MSTEANINAETERNDAGAFLIAPGKIAGLLDYTRYNGGWTKTVTALDTAKTNGFSIVGEFVENKTTWMAPGVYLDCGIGGSRSRHRKSYAIYRIAPDGALVEYGSSESERDWATALWPAIRAALADAAAEGEEGETLSPLAGYRDDEIRTEAIRRGLLPPENNEGA